MKKTRKILSLFLSLAMLLSAFSITALASGINSENVFEGVIGVGDMSDYYKDNLSWTIENGALIISGDGEMRTYDMLNRTPWYLQKDSITSIVVEDGVTSISQYAFYELTNVKTVSISESVKSIGYSAFGFCSSLTEIEIPSSISKIEGQLFFYCLSLKNVILTNSITYIGENAFYTCESLKTITIPSSVKTIGKDAFGCCFALENICGKEGSAAEAYAKENGIDFVSIGASGDEEESSEESSEEISFEYFPEYNYAEGKSYTVSGAFLEGKEDDGVMLTDGLIPFYETSGATVAFVGTNSVNLVTIDLGKVFTDIKRVTVSGIVIDGNRQYSAKVKTSTDGNNFYYFSAYTTDEELLAGPSYSYTYAPTKAASARYIQVEFTNPAYVLTVGEIQVFGNENVFEESSEDVVVSEESSEDAIVSEESSEEILPEDKYFGFNMSASINAEDSSIIDVVLSIKDIKEELCTIELLLTFDPALVEGVVQESERPMDVFMTKVPMYTMQTGTAEILMPRYEQICTYEPDNKYYHLRFLDLLQYANAKPGEEYNGLINDEDIIITIQFRLLDGVPSNTDLVFEAKDVKGTATEGLIGVPGAEASATVTVNTFLPIDPESEHYLDSANNTMPNVVEKTTASEIVSALGNHGISAVITDKDGNALDSTAFVGTGCKVKASDGNEYTIIIKGDVDGSGDVTATDYLNVKRVFLNVYSLENEYFKAADTDGDGAISATDYIQIKGYFLGNIDIYK